MGRRILAILWLSLVGVSNAADDPTVLPVKEPELRAELLRREGRPGHAASSSSW